MIKCETVNVYDWFDLQVELCKIMGIQENQFRDFEDHKNTGVYKDFWHVALEYIIPNQLSNDTIVKIYNAYVIEDWAGEEPWENLVLKAWNELYFSLVEGEENEDEGILVKFNW